MAKKEGRKSTDAQLRAIKKYQEAHDELKLRMPKGKKEVFRKAAEEQGISLNQYTLKALEEKMQRDKRIIPDPLPDPVPAKEENEAVNIDKIIRQIKRETRRNLGRK